jgi:hypothetical protein
MSFHTITRRCRRSLGGGKSYFKPMTCLNFVFLALDNNEA